MINKHPDFALVDKYLSGDRPSGEMLFAKAFVKVKAYVFKSTSKSQLNESDKNDIVSQSLYIAIEKLSVYNGLCSFSTYVGGISNNLIKEKYKKIKHEYENISDITNEIDSDLGSLLFRSPEYVVIKKEEKETLLKALAILPEDDKNILLLRATNGMKYIEIGKMFDLSEDAVRKRFGRAVLKIKNILESLNY